MKFDFHLVFWVVSVLLILLLGLNKLLDRFMARMQRRLQSLQEEAERRSEAARRGWETRRARQMMELGAMAAEEGRAAINEVIMLRVSTASENVNIQSVTYKMPEPQRQLPPAESERTPHRRFLDDDGATPSGNQQNNG